MRGVHLLRNAVSHGVETPSEREAGRKPRAGRVRLSVETRKDRLLVAVEDDGRGLDPARIAQAAIARGLLTPAEAASRSAADLADILFQPGFSTAEAVTNVSGRGLGLSVVRETVARLQGEVAILNRVHGGIRVSLSVPISISTQHVLLVESSGQVFALPASFVERLWRGDVENIERVEGRQAIVLDSRPVFVANLSSVLGITYAGITPRPAGGDHAEGRVNVAVIASAARRAGFMVDRFLDYREAVIKDLGVPPSMSGFTAGGIPLEDGRVAVVIAPGALLDRFLDTGWQAAAIQTPEEAPPRKQPRILVVDDSITTRSLEKSILEAHGYQVRVAVDGVQALEQLRAEPADLVITDIMMPRMDGLELLRQIKGDRDIAHVPVIVVSSMEKREEQERGLSLGADAYIVKRKFDQRELLETVRQIL
jgi:two-component system chemotaxis sensor kinase CheA